MPRLLVCLALLAIASCGVRPRPPYTGPGGPGTPVPAPFAPHTLEVHPLTRLTRDPDGNAMLLCHIELRDAWGDTCKSTGDLRVELYRGAPGDATGVQELLWEVDMNDLERNAAFFDPATRTYRIPLRDVPEWATREGDSTRLSVRAALSTLNPKGEPVTLRDEFALR